MKTKQNPKSWFKSHTLLLWFISGLIYIIALPFVELEFYNRIPNSYYLLIILTDIGLVVAFTISFILAIMLVSYLFRHFRIIYYPKGRRGIK